MDENKCEFQLIHRIYKRMVTYNSPFLSHCLINQLINCLFELSNQYLFITINHQLERYEMKMMRIGMIYYTVKKNSQNKYPEKHFIITYL